MSWSVASGLEGKGVIVTGAAGGIGLATAQAFAESGARVFVVDLDPEKSEAVAMDLPGEGHRMREGRRRPFLLCPVLPPPVQNGPVLL